MFETVVDSIYVRVGSVDLRQHRIVPGFVKVKCNALKLDSIVQTYPCFMTTSARLSWLISPSDPGTNRLYITDLLGPKALALL